MKKNKCPHCHNKQLENNICSYCYNDMNTIETNPYLHRQLRMALALDNKNEIARIAKQIIDIDHNNLYAKYAYAYGMINNDSSLIHNFFYENKFGETIASHIISHIDAFPKEMANAYLENFYGKEKAHQLLNGIDEISVPDKLNIDFELRTKTTYEDNLRTSLLLLGVGFALIIFVSIVGVISLSRETRYFGTVLYYTIPSLFIGGGITRLLLKKGNKILTVFFGLVFLILFTYVVLLPHSSNFIDHVGRVLLAPVEAIDYYAMRVVE